MEQEVSISMVFNMNSNSFTGTLPLSIQSMEEGNHPIKRKQTITPKVSYIYIVLKEMKSVLRHIGKQKTDFLNEICLTNNTCTIFLNL